MIDIPALIIHGNQHADITPDHAERVYVNLKTPVKQLVPISDGYHGDLKERPEYQTLMTDFVDNL